MNRRESLKGIAASTIGLAAFSTYLISCKGSTDSVDVKVANESDFFTPSEKSILASIADTIIPAGTSIGALSVGTDKFLERLFEKCYEKEVQDNIKAQFVSLENAADKAYGKAFSKCDQKQREEILLTFSNSEVEAEKNFFDLMKSETIRGYRTSEEVMTKYLNYVMAPGFYNGCAEVKETV